MNLTPEHRAYLNAAAITDEVIEAAGIQSGTWTVVGDDGEPEKVPAIIIPWRDSSGRTVRQGVMPELPKDRRYRFPSKAKGGTPPLNHIRTARWDAPWLIVEGTKQSHAAASWAPPGWGVVGMNGCEGWHGQDLSGFEGAHVAVVFDKDVTSNRRVHDAAVALFKALTDAGAASIRFPVLDGDGTDGLDDVLSRMPEADRKPYITRLFNDAKPDVPDFVDPEEEWFWQARPVLAHVQQYARARRVSPWATLGVVLARVVAAVPPAAVLPPQIGGYGSLNLFVALTGPSGVGKGGAISTGRDAVEIAEAGINRPHPIFETKLGTGQGMAHAYMHKVPINPDKPNGSKKWEQARDRVLFINPEIDNITAHANQNAATLMSEVRSAFSGEMLGQHYADPDRRVIVRGHAYRMCLIVGVQPKRARALMDDAAGGTPQRFLWFPVRDDNRPEVPPECPEPWEWKVPGDFRTRVVIDVCEQARRDVDADFIARQDAEDDADDLDAHAMFVRLKVAAAFGLLDGRCSITDEDWELSRVVMAVSLRTRQGVVSALRSEDAKRSAIRRAEAVRTSVEVHDAEEARKVEKAAKRAVTVLTKRGDWLAAGKLKAEAGSAYRDHIQVALDDLLDRGVIESQESDNTVKYRLARQ